MAYSPRMTPSSWTLSLRAIAAAFVSALVGTDAVAQSTRAEKPARPAPADLVLRGGPVYTMDAARSWARAVAVANGRIVFVGSEAAAAPWIGPRTRVVDLA